VEESECRENYGFSKYDIMYTNDLNCVLWCIVEIITCICVNTTITESARESLTNTSDRIVEIVV
jgi:hypothetical protein